MREFIAEVACTYGARLFYKGEALTVLDDRVKVPRHFKLVKGTEPVKAKVKKEAPKKVASKKAVKASKPKPTEPNLDEGFLG